VMDAMGTTRSASFATNSSEVLASTTRAIFDFTPNGDGATWAGAGFLGIDFDTVGADGDRAGAVAAPPLCAAKTNSLIALWPEKNEKLRNTKAQINAQLQTP